MPPHLGQKTWSERCILALGTVLSEEDPLEDGLKSKVNKEAGEHLGKCKQAHSFPQSPLGSEYSA